MGIWENIGFYNLTLIIIFHIISTFIVYIKKSDIITKHINNIIFGIKNLKLIKPEQKAKINETNNIINMKQFYNQKNKKDCIIKTNKLNLSKNNKNIIFPNKKKNSLKRKNPNKTKKKVKNIKNSKNLKKLRHNKKSQSIKNIQNNIYFNNNSNMINNKKENLRKNTQEINRKKNNIKNQSEQKTIKKVKLIMKYTDEEINNLTYDLALLYDKRSYCEYYISLLKTNHILIFSFCFKNDYNSKIIKIDLFFVSFAMYYTTNALFFDDDTMHKIYVNKGSFDLEYQLPKILYSSIISFALNKILTLLALSDNGLIDLKNNKNIKNIDSRAENLKRRLKIKFGIYFIISLIFLLLFWYYISMFGAIYKNTQLHLVKDTLISFGLSLVFPFGTSLLPGLFRIPALSNHKNKRKCLYIISKLLQIL